MPNRTLIGKNIDVALVLGSGGARGAILIGILEVFEKHKIPINLIVGCSAGAIVGTMYSYYGHSNIVADKLLNLSFDDVIDISWKNYINMITGVHGLSNEHNFAKMLSHQLPQGNLENLPLPVIIVATDIETFAEVEIATGDIVKAVLASSSAPPYFSPVQFKDKVLSDGGICSPVPVSIAKKYNPKIIIAVNITQHHSKFSIKNMLQLSHRSLDIAHYHLAHTQSLGADIIIHPKTNIDGTDAHKTKELYAIGQKEALKALPKIKELLSSKGIPIT